jgi:AcrR family transcriptional regulator
VSRGERRPLTRERVLEAAIELTDAEGLDALSMRRLAKELGVEAMSLYGHVENKDDILGGMLDRVVAEIELPGDEVDWKTAVRRNVVSDRDMRVRHRWVSSLSMRQQGGGTAQLRRGDWLLRRLRDGGFPEQLVYHAYHVLEAYVLGYAGLQLGFPYRGEELAGKARGFLDSIPVEEYPDLVRHIHQHLEPHEGESGFELGLDLILDGLERIRDSE